MFNFFQQFCCYTKREKPDKSQRPTTLMSVQPMKVQIPDPILETDQYLQLDDEIVPQDPFFDELPFESSTQISSDIQEIQPQQGEMQFESHSNSNGILQKPIRKIDQRQVFIDQYKKRVLKIWDQDEDEQLKIQFAIHGGKWSEIVKHMPGRNVSQCSQRYRRLMPMMGTRKQWTKEEDDKIEQLVKQYDRRWKEIALRKFISNYSIPDFPGILSKQIRERYINNLDPSINKEPFTEEEDLIILRMHNEQGCKWSQISKALKGRSENMVKNRFYSYIRRVHLGVKNPYQEVYQQDQIEEEFLYYE